MIEAFEKKRLHGCRLYSTRGIEIAMGAREEEVRSYDELQSSVEPGGFMPNTRCSSGRCDWFSPVLFFGLLVLVTLLRHDRSAFAPRRMCGQKKERDSMQPSPARFLSNF